MNIVFFAHPDFLGHQSMPRLAKMQAEGMKLRGHDVEIWSPDPIFFRIPFQGITRKWLGYIDQYILFPNDVRNRLKKCPKNTLFVFTDQALGPWVPLVANRPHVVHCNDFLAQHSALGKTPEYVTSWSGRQYQRFIRYGLTKSKNFISISQKTKDDLHNLLPEYSFCSEMVYLGLNQTFELINSIEARHMLGHHTGVDLSSGYLLHVGGNHWNKNRPGVIELYDALRSIEKKILPLLLIGSPPDQKLIDIYNQSPYKADIHFFSNMNDELVRIAYAGASVFLFPSIGEGFGWPIAEAMASGCPVVTTAEAPMTEVAGQAGFFIPRRPYINSAAKDWANQSAKIIHNVINLTSVERESVIQAGLENAKRFNPYHSLNQTELIYKNIIEKHI